ncbi:subfamily B ATP-binding cassette protein MsbA [Haloferula luteola]|uniref:Subfamily B ATP-binding cassette protein MsbA n=1 Tax=Haloferula luteola TaxID=595692 RepID=A0A840VFQ2_9BACT|nr:ABC transporter ATP-binding protein [Haloferula luteola]MBB5352649.1 subfamily B ATP-binding cassette protein MsbA [Haloferula luteola]
MNRYAPYFALLKGARGRFLAGLAAGIVYALASGAGMPLMIKTVFPIIFRSDKIESVESAPEPPKPKGEFRQWLDSLVPDGVKKTASFINDHEAVREYFDQRWGEEKGRSILLMSACAIIPLVAAVRGISNFLNVYWVASAGVEVLVKLQGMVFAKIQRLPLAFFSGKKTGDLTNRVMGDASMLQSIVTTAANDLLKQPFTLIAAIGYLVADGLSHQESFFLMLCLLSIPLVVVPVRLMAKRLMFRAARMQAEAGSNSAVLVESLGSTREIRAFNLEELMNRRFEEGKARWNTLNMKVLKYRFSSMPIIETLAALVVAVALYYGARHELTLERFLAVVGALYLAYDAMKKIAAVFSRLKEGEASLDRLEVILNADEDVRDPENPVEIGRAVGSLEFSTVSFHYDDKPALEEVAVQIPAGQIVALVGPSGAGKTTFASLVPRFYDPVEGAVKLDGLDIRQLRLKDLRNQITLVPQEAVLFSGTIGDNIRLGRMNATDEEVIQAAKMANADDFIRAKPHGYDTMVGERGAQLSGGQRQRISIARAFLKDAPVLILDEATASLDSESEAQIQQELATLAKGRTTLIIAHRFSSIRIADRILVFEGGRIVGDGTFDELAASHDLFRALLERQRH